MSSPTSYIDYGNSGFDRRNLDDGEITGDGDYTNMFPTTMRTYCRP